MAPTPDGAAGSGLARLLGLGVSVALIAVSAACSDSSGTADERVTAPTPTAAANAGLGDAPSGATSPGAAASTRAPSSAGGAPSAAVVTDAAFVSPSGNIGCFLTVDGARCDIAQKSWAAPPAPDDCDLAWGSGVTVGKSGEATFTCAGDTVLGAQDKLGYGQALKAGTIRCDSTSTGMRCENTATGHGFIVAKEKYDLF